MANSWINLLLLVYPIGAVYQTTDNNLSPAIIFGGGEWKLLSQQDVSTQSGSTKTIYLYERTA